MPGEKEQGKLRKGWVNSFFQTPNEIYDFSVSGHAKSVYIYLCRCADNDNQSFPGYGTIADRVGFSKSTIRRAIDDLIDCGLLLKENRGRKENGEYYSNLYTLIHPSDVPPRGYALTDHTPPSDIVGMVSQNIPMSPQTTPMFSQDTELYPVTIPINNNDDDYDYARDNQNNPLIKTENIKTPKDSLGAIQEPETQEPETTLDDLEWVDQTGEPPIPPGQAMATDKPTRPLTAPTADADCGETPHSHPATTPAHDSTPSLRAVDTFDVGEGGADVYTALAGLKKAPAVDGQPAVMLQPDMSQDQLDEIYENVEARMTAYTTRPYRLKLNEYKTLNSLLVSGVPIDFIFANIDYSFVIKPGANSFQYCSYVIKTQWEVELAKKAPVEKIKWGEGQDRKKNIGSGSSSQAKVDRVVPAAQPGKYERFYQIYQGKNSEQTPLQSEKSEQPAEKLLNAQANRNGYGFDRAIGKMNHDGDDIIL